MANTQNNSRSPNGAFNANALHGEELSQGTTYQEEEFQPGTNTGYQRPKTLRPNTPTETVDDDDDEDEEDYEEDETIIDKIKSRPIIIVIIIVVVILFLIGIIAVVSVAGKHKSDNAEETTEEVNEGALSEDEILAQLQAQQEADMQAQQENVTETTSFEYTAEDREVLAAWGKTADEIAEYEANETPVQEAVKEVRNQYMDNRAEVYKNLLRNSTDNPNESYHYVLGNSIFGLPIQKSDTWSDKETYYGDTANVDYRKIPLQGYQAMIRITIPNTDYVLYANIPYLKYKELPESGNVEIHYDVTEKDGMIYYTNITIVE